MHCFLFYCILICIGCGVGGDPLSESIHRVLKKALHGSQSLPRSLIRRALFYGDEDRLRKALVKAYSGEELVISAIGAQILPPCNVPLHSYLREPGQGLAALTLEGEEIRHTSSIDDSIVYYLLVSYLVSPLLIQALARACYLSIRTLLFLSKHQ